MRTLLILGILALAPISVFAADFIPLAPLPLNFGGDTNTIAGYLNAVFGLAIAVGALLAVIRIGIGGFQMMTSEAVGTIKDSRTAITMAIVGLVLLLSVTLILTVINPNIVNLEALNFETIKSDVTPAQSPQNNTTQTPPPLPTEDTTSGVTEHVFYSGAINEARRCVAQGGTARIEQEDKLIGAIWKTYCTKN